MIIILLLMGLVAMPASATTSLQSSNGQNWNDSKERLTDMWYQLSPLWIYLCLLMSLGNIFGSLKKGGPDIYSMIQKFVGYNISTVNLLIFLVRGIITIFAFTAQAAAPLIQSSINLITAGVQAGAMILAMLI